jgi:hypothetical protein
VGLSQTDTMKLFGPPAERKNLPPSQIWTYHSTVCDMKLDGSKNLAIGRDI